jgi:large subunit ribosomal protein L32
MANPKRKTSKARRDKRRTHWKLSAVNLSECSNCHQPKQSHRVCPHCGYYNGRMVYQPKE